MPGPLWGRGVSTGVILQVELARLVDGSDKDGKNERKEWRMAPMFLACVEAAFSKVAQNRGGVAENLVPS